jgi:hypothetical protein
VAEDGVFGVGHARAEAGEVRAEDDVGRGRFGLQSDASDEERNEFLVRVGGEGGCQEGRVEAGLGGLVEVERGNYFAMVVVAEVPDGTLTAGVEFGVKDDKRGVGGAAGV